MTMSDLPGAAAPFEPGLYRHFKGKLYEALFVAHDSVRNVPVQEHSDDARSP